MKKFSYLLFLLTGILFSSELCYGQRIEVLRSNFKSFQDIYTHLIYIDAKGDTSDIERKDLKITGCKIDSLNVNCIKACPYFTMVLTIDNTNSMWDTMPNSSSKRGDIAKGAAVRAIYENSSLPPCYCKMIINRFSNYSELVHDFSKDRDSLKNSVYNRISFDGMGTNYNGGLIDGPFSALNLAKKAIDRGECQPAILFITDGQHNAEDPVKTQEIINLANSMNARIFTIYIGDDVGSKDLDLISNNTKAVSYVCKSEDCMSWIIPDIIERLHAFYKLKGCDVTFETDCDCKEFVIEYKGQKVTLSIPDSVKPDLLVGPDNTLKMLNQTTASKKFQIRAKNNEVVVSGLKYNGDTLNNSKTSSGSVSVNWGNMVLPSTLKEGEAKDITITYTLNDTACHEEQIEILSSSCTDRFINVKYGWIVAYDVNMGNKGISAPPSPQDKQVICNYSCDDITITENPALGPPNNSDFTLQESLIGKVVKDGECLTAKFNFTPAQTGTRESALTWTVGGIAFKKKIYGNGIGLPDFPMPVDFEFDNTTCQSPVSRKTFYIVNIGPVPLIVNNIKIEPDESIFDMDNITFPETVPPGESLAVNINFEVTAMNYNQQTATLRVLSNSYSGTDRTMTLKGTRENEEFSVSPLNSSVGYVCPGDEIKMSFKVNNIGTIEEKFQLIKDADITVAPAAVFVVAEKQSQDVQLSFYAPQNEGPFEKSILVKNLDCNTEYRFVITGEVDVPKIIINEPIKSTANKGGSSKTVHVYRIESKRPLVKVQIVETNPYINILSLVDFDTIPGLCTLMIEFTPEEPGNVNDIITFKLPCGDTTIDFQGSVNAAKATITADNLSGRIGETKNALVHLINASDIASSGATQIKTEFASSPAGYLNEPFAPMPWQNITSLNYALPVTALNYYASPIRIDIKNTSVDQGKVDITEKEFYYTIIQCAAKISVESASRKPGEDVALSVYLENSQNIDSFHEGIKVKLNYNASLLDALEGSEGAISGGFRTIEKVFPVNQAFTAAKTKLGEFRFKAMLGNSESTEVKIDEAGAVKGMIEFEKVNGLFALDGVCRDGEIIRLFDPWGSSLTLEANPNPAQNSIIIDFSVRESGQARLKLSNAAGAIMAEIVNGDVEKGQHKIEYDASNLPAGAYLLSLETALGAKTLLINVVK